MSDWNKIRIMAARVRKERLFGIRMKIMLPILVLFIPGMAWGFSDPNIILPGGHQPSNAMEVLFYASLGIVFGATMCAVLLSFDGISRDRASGMLEVRLAQPMPRKEQATALILGYWQTILIPVYALMMVSLIIVRVRMNEWPSLIETIVYFLSTALILLWYTLFALIASTSAKEQGTAVAFGVGVWFFFTFLWALVTTMVAYASGISIGEAKDPAWVALEGALDLLSPNGVYHHLLETQLPTIERGIATWQAWAMAIVWSVIPWRILHRRMEALVP
ncbi:MAG: ABC transporter permease [Candidatus Poseidonia sp.]|nr:ABC transporter permease [Poseidonia sp.]